MFGCKKEIKSTKQQIKLLKTICSKDWIKQASAEDAEYYYFPLCKKCSQRYSSYN